MKKRILITGAGSGFGEGTAIGLAKKGHEVIAGVHIWPQLTALQKKTKSLGLKNLRIEKLDILDHFDVANAAKWDIDILFSNAAIGYSGPLAEIPIELLREIFETNVFAGLNLAQKFIRKFIDEKRPGKIVFTSSALGLISAPYLGPYSATKHALQSIAEAMQDELRPYKIQVQTINPGAYKTGFNDAMAQTASHWMDDKKNFTKKSVVQKYLDAVFEDQMDPEEMIKAMIEIIPAGSGKFLNIADEEVESLIKKSEADAWKNKI